MPDTTAAAGPAEAAAEPTVPVTAAGRKRARVRPRRERLLEVTIELVAREGIDAVTHRRVAELAQVPLGSTTYYFASREEMLVEALQSFGRQEIAALRARLAEPPARRPSRRRYVDELVEFMVPQLGDDHWRTLAQYTLLCEAARRPELEPVAREWNQAWWAVLEEFFQALKVPDPGLEARMLLAMLDGFLLQQLAAPDPDFVAGVLKPALRRVFARVQPAGGS
jgi:TetR/AcrR family transcriptional regulator, regulator of biofilm formation and stress response